MAEQKKEKPVVKIKEKAQRAFHVEAVSAPVRKYRAMLFQWALLLVAGSFAVLTFLVKAMPSFAIDLQITQFIQLINIPFFALFMSLISWPGFLPQSIIITALTILLIYRFGLQWESLMVLFAATFSTGVNVLVKDLIQRPRPTVGLVNVISTLTGYSFPSGHVMFYLGYFGFFAFLVFSLLKPSPKRSLLLILLCSLIILIGPSRIFLGQHWASDVLGAYLLGSLTLVAIIQFYRWGKTRFFVHHQLQPHHCRRKRSAMDRSTIRKWIVNENKENQICLKKIKPSTQNCSHLNQVWAQKERTKRKLTRN